MGYVLANAIVGRSDSADSMSSLSSYISPTTAAYQAGSNSNFWGGSERDREMQGVIGASGCVLSEITQTVPPQSPLSVNARQPVHFSNALEEVVTALSEHRRTARGRYLVGDSPNKRMSFNLILFIALRTETSLRIMSLPDGIVISEHMGVKRYFDELHMDSYTGTMSVFYNDEPLQQKPDKLFSKLLNKSW